MKYPKSEIEAARVRLTDLCPPGTTIYTQVTHVARSGMTRSIRAFVMQDNAPNDITYWASRLLGESVDQKNGGLKRGGCGMDMGYYLMMNLSYKLHGHESVGKGALPENSGRPFKPSPGHYRAGYSLEHRWL